MAHRIVILEAKKNAMFERVNRLYETSKRDLSRDTRLVENFLAQSETLTDVNRAIIREFTLIVDELIELNISSDKKYEPDLQVLNAFEDLVSQIIFKRNQFLSQKTQGKSDMQKCANSYIKLPAINIPFFDGKLENWSIFYESFKTNIHLNETLNDSQRIQYLIGKLSDTALNIISGIIPTGENYADIWKNLVKKYQDKRSLGIHYVHNILDIKSTSNTAISLNHFSEKISSSVAAFKQLGVADNLDFVLFCCVSRKLDPVTLNEFEMSTRDKEIPTLSELIEFIKSKAKILERTINTNNSSYKDVFNKSNNLKSKPQNLSKTFMANINTPQEKCVPCGKQHSHFYHCDKFKELNPIEKFNIVKASKGCINCLSYSHRSNNCKSDSSCKKCNKRHHTLLHFDNNESTKRSASHNDGSLAGTSSSPIIANLSTSLCARNNKIPQSKVVLSTAQVYAYSNENNKRLIRCLIDNASQNNLINMACCNRLNLKIIPLTNSVIKGVGTSTRPIHGFTFLKIESHTSRDKYNIQCLVLDHITEALPTEYIDPQLFPKLTTIPLADLKWNIPGEIDIVLGAQLFPYILMGGRIELPNLSPLIETVFGYIIMGNVPITTAPHNVTDNVKALTSITHIDQKQFDSIACCIISNNELETTLHKFWELEEIPIKKYFSPEEIACENMFRSTVSRDTNGRYIVHLPFLKNPVELGTSRAVAQRRLMIQERKFKNNPALRNSYNEVINEYRKNGYLVEIPRQSESADGYYIPHQAVIREDKTTSKVRIVLDASAKTHSGLSLNDVLHVGPNLQADLMLLLLNFRLGAVAITADIKQMYLRIRMTEEHQKYQKILYRFDSNESIQTYKFTCVPFGLKSSPFLAMRTIHELAANEGQSFPRAAKIATSNFYMDDLVKSIPESPGNRDAINLVQELISFFAAGGFELVKFSSNSTELLSSLPPQKCASVNLSDNTNLKILGLEWVPKSDVFSFKISHCNEQCTKRTILSVVARLFDVLGLVSPVILLAKLLIKSLWSANIGWDEVPPDSIKNAYENVIKELPLLSKLHIPRYLNMKHGCTVNIVAFCDASLKAYGCAVYLHVTDSQGNISVNLLCSKSKVAPLKIVTLARLELCAAVLLSKLVRIVYNSINPLYNINNIYAFSDSTIALSWIHSSPHRWSIFVSNRVANIHENLNAKHFFHIGGIENPSDCLSRGLLPSQLLTHNLWWHGPGWLAGNPNSWPLKSFTPSANSDLPEFNSKTLTAIVKEESFFNAMVLRVSSWKKLLHIMVYILRFIKKIHISKIMTLDHLNLAEIYIIRIVQQHHFAKEYNDLKKGQILSKPFGKLNLILDSNNIIRIGGRLSNADLSYEMKHPALLPKSDRVVDLLIDYYHVRNCHTGADLLNSFLKQKYWIISARNAIRKRVRLCNSCFRIHPRGPTPKMADLPSFRVCETPKAFTHTGVDYAGPIHVTLTRRRGQRSQKAYICLFTCLTTRAVHIELASDLSSDTFMSAFKRFLSRRGPISHLYSDNGTNFVGAKAQLNEIYSFTESSKFKEILNDELLNRRIVWKLNPPHAPHFGGCWESMVKSFKTHLYRVIGSQILTYEELLTVLIQIETILNSRPLTLLSEDPNIEVLTPAHFLMSTPLQFLPAPEISSQQVNLVTRKHLLDNLVQSYWKRWKLEYLHTLQVRQKWLTESKPIQVGMVVIIDQGDVPPLHWPVGRVEEVYPGSDGIIRVALVKTATGVIKRPVVKLCPIPTQ